MRLVDGQRLRVAADPGTWRVLATNRRWAREPPCPSPPFGKDVPAGVTVRWPAAYQHPNAAPFVAAIRDGLGTMAGVTRAQIPQPYEGIVLLEIDVGEGPRRVAIDYFDFTFVNPACAEEVDVYFKYQYLDGGYPELPHVVPGGYVASRPFLYENWCRLRRLRRESAPTADVFGRFGLRYSGQLRRAAVEQLADDPRLAFAGGTRPTLHARYLREMATARVCVDLPGQGPFCYRLVEALAMGCCIVGPRHATSLPVALEEGTEIIHCADDLSDLADLCVTYVADADARSAVGAAAGRYFDDHLHPQRLAEHYIREVKDRPSTRAD